MKGSILIVEDQFVEANDLNSILENAGYSVSGIARSVAQAEQMIESLPPDIVLIDIFLKGDATGIDLAKTLAKKDIPFIYLSANSNASTLEEAKATKPYGFLVKPFREKDILIALEIAMYRHGLKREVMTRHERWLSGLLSKIAEKEIGMIEKMISLARALQSAVHFDQIIIDTDVLCSDFRSVSGFRRINYDEYSTIDMPPEESSALAREIGHIRGLAGDGLAGDGLANGGLATGGGRIVCRNGVGSSRSLFGARSNMVVPVGDGVVALYSQEEEGFTDEQVDLLGRLLPVLTALLRNIGGLRQRGVDPGTSGGKGVSGFFGIVGQNPKLLQALDQLTQVAAHDTSVLIMGETGTGKEGLVNVIYQLSPRRSGPLIKINCAAIPKTLVESELFGHEKGAFTGATELRIGKFEQAQGGTIFLDEIGEIPLDVQSRLLRVLQEKEIERLGGRQTIKTDVRVITATNRNLFEEVAKGNFRMDLYYRLDVFPIRLPPLRDRKEDIPLLVEHFLLKQAAVMGSGVKTVSPLVIEQLMGYSWPGNIRQLEHVIERAMILNKESVIHSIDLPEELETVAGPVVEEVKLQSIEEVERSHIMAVIKNCNGKISGKGGAAEILQLPVTSLRARMKKLGIHWQYYFALLLFILVAFSGKAQKGMSQKEIDLTRLQVSSGFLVVAKDATIDLDSGLAIASRRDRLSRVPVITEGFGDEDDKWMDAGAVGLALRRLKGSDGRGHVRWLLSLGAWYSFYPGFEKKYIDSGIYYLKSAKAGSDEMGMKAWSGQALILLGKCYMKGGDIESGKAAFEAVTGDTGFPADLRAKAFNYEGMYCPFNAATMLIRIGNLERSLALYKQLDDRANQINTLMDMGYLNFAAGRIKVSDSAAEQSILLQKRSGFPYTHYSTDLRSFLALIQNKYAIAIRLGMEESENAELTRDSLGLAYFYFRVGSGYWYVENHHAETSLWYKKSIGEFIKYGGDRTLYRVFSSSSFLEDVIGGGRPVLELINTLLKEYPPLNPLQEEDAYIALGTCYEASKDYKNAEKYYLIAEKLDPANREKRAYADAGLIYNKLGFLYRRMRNYEKVRFYSTKFIGANSKINVVDSLGMLSSYRLLFEADSALGHFAEMKNLYNYAMLEERYYTKAQRREVEELNIRYQTLQKQRDLETYRARNLLQEQRARTTWRLSLVALVVLVFVIVMILLRYMSKQKSNRLLQAQKDEIDRKNIQLQHVIGEKDDLLVSKEWLLKEVHHRVKNNLQIVTSLLNSQSNYIKDERALSAVMEGRHRVQAMSLIHQKLYKSDNVSSIDMPEYIAGLVDYLKDSFKTGLSIYFEMELEPIRLDVSQAIPVGLILNEVITNAIKYAFPHTEEDRIVISLSQSDMDEVRLVVADNGKGLPPGFEASRTNSFGMKLIKGLAEDLDGQFGIGSAGAGDRVAFGAEVAASFDADAAASSGTVVRVVFPLTKFTTD